MESTGRQSTPEETYHEIVQATSTPEVLNALFRNPSVPMKTKTLALRKIARNYKISRSKSEYSDYRYHKLKNDVLCHLDKLQRQEMCDVLYWLRVMHESYVNLEWLGGECLGRLNDRLIALANSGRFRPNQLINVLCDASLLRLNTEPLEDLVADMLHRPETHLNTAETHMAISSFFFLFDNRREKLLNGLYAYLQRSDYFKVCEAPLVLMTLQCLAETTNEYMPFHRLFQIYSVREMEKRIALVDNDNMQRMARIMEMFPEQVSLSPLLLPSIALRLERGLILSLTTSVKLMQCLFRFHQAGAFLWTRPEKAILRLLERAEKSKEITEVEAEVLLSLLSRLHIQLQPSELKQVLRYSSLYPLNTLLSLSLVHLALLAGSESAYVQEVLDGLMREVAVVDASVICKYMDQLARIQASVPQTQIAVLQGKYEKMIGKLIGNTTAFRHFLYYSMAHSVPSKLPFLYKKNCENRLSWDQLLFKYIAFCYFRYPREAKTALMALRSTISAEKLVEALQPTGLPLEFESLVEVLKRCKEALAPEVLLLLLKHAESTASKLECALFSHLLDIVPGNYYNQRVFGMIWKKFEEVLTKSQLVVPHSLARNLANGALGDLERASSLHSSEFSTPMSVLTFLYSTNNLLDFEATRLRSVLSTPYLAQFPLFLASFPEIKPYNSAQLQQAATLPFPCSMKQFFSAVATLREYPDRPPELDKQYMAVCEKQIRLMTIEEVIQLLITAKAENASSGDQLSWLISEKVAGYWRSTETVLDRKQALKVFQIMAEPGNYHADLCEMARSRLDLSKLDISQKVGALAGLAIGIPQITDWLVPVIEEIQGDQYLLGRYGSSLLDTFHDSNLIQFPHCVSLAQHYMTLLPFNDRFKQHFSFLQSAPYLLRAGIMPADMLRTLQQYLPKDGRAGWTVRRFVLEKFYEEKGKIDAWSQFSPNNHPEFAHSKLRELVQTCLPTGQVFPAEMPLAPLYLPGQKTAIWLHPPKFLQPRGDQLQGDYYLYKALLERKGCRVVTLPVLPRASVAAVWKLVSTRVKI